MEFLRYHTTYVGLNISKLIYSYFYLSGSVVLALAIIHGIGAILLYLM